MVVVIGYVLVAANIHFFRQKMPLFPKKALSLQQNIAK